ncbi:MAG: hypothetical protein WCJ28_05440 [Actinomycetota bacterium]
MNPMRSSLRRTALGVTALMASAISLSACAGNASAQARRACHEVDRAISAYQSAQQQSAPLLKQQKLSEASHSLTIALGYAADATSSDGSWNALMTTISQSVNVGIEKVIPSLTANCKIAESDSPYMSFSPSNGSLPK